MVEQANWVPKVSEFQSLRETMEKCSEIVTEAYSIPLNCLQMFDGDLPPGHRSTDRRQRFLVSEHNGDLIVALPGTTHPFDWSSNLRVHYTPVDGSMPPAGTTMEQLDEVPCAHAGFYYRAETVPTLALLQQAADKGCRLVLTGHSLGGAVANLCTLTALTAQKRAQEAATTAARAASVKGRSRQKRSKQRTKAALQSISGSTASTNTSCCSGNGSVNISAQAALVEVLCVSFASPVFANSALVQMIEESGWEDSFVNVVVPEDYCLKLFNNVLTSAPQPDGLSRSGSSYCNLKTPTKQQLEYAEFLEDPFDQEPVPASPLADPFAYMAKIGCECPAADSTAHSSDNSECGSGCNSSSIDGSGLGRRFSYQGSMQPGASALAGKNSRSSSLRRSKRQLSFAQPLHQQLADEAPDGAGSALSSPNQPAASKGVADAPAEGAAVRKDDLVMNLPAVACCPPDIRLCEEEPGSNWTHMPSSPSGASLLSESSWSSTRSWRLLAYLPEIIGRSFSSNLKSFSSWDASSSSCSSSRAGSATSSEAGVSAESMATSLDKAAGSDHSSASSGDGRDIVAGGSADFIRLRHAHSTFDLSQQQDICTGIASSGSDSSSGSLSSLEGTTPERTQPEQQHHSSSSSLRKSLSSASLILLNQAHKRVLQPFAYAAQLPGSSLSLVSSLLPSRRMTRTMSKVALRAASAVSDRALSIPLAVLESGLIRALKPPMYQPVGQQWVLSVTGLVPQSQPITQYPRHVHDVFWHKELVMVAFREHSIVFYKQRLLQQARRR